MMESEPLPIEAHSLAGRLQHTLISNIATRPLVEAHLRACVRHGFHAAMVPPFTVPFAAAFLAGSGVRIASWIDFPLGTSLPAAKVAATARLVEAGVDELDLMPNVAWLLDGNEQGYHDEVAAVVEAASGRPVKLMLELPLLPPPLRERVVELAVSAGVSYVKNASGGAVGGATVEDIAFLRARVPASVGVKASGGIRSARQAIALLEAGAHLLGTSAAEQIMAELSPAPDPRPALPGEVEY